MSCHWTEETGGEQRHALQRPRSWAVSCGVSACAPASTSDTIVRSQVRSDLMNGGWPDLADGWQQPQEQRAGRAGAGPATDELSAYTDILQMPSLKQSHHRQQQQQQQQTQRLQAQLQQERHQEEQHWQQQQQQQQPVTRRAQARLQRQAQDELHQDEEHWQQQLQQLHAQQQAQRASRGMLPPEAQSGPPYQGR